MGRGWGEGVGRQEGEGKGGVTSFLQLICFPMTNILPVSNCDSLFSVSSLNSFYLNVHQ